MNWPGLGLFEICGVKKTKLLRILDEMRYSAHHQPQKLGRLQTVLVQVSSLKARFYGICRIAKVPISLQVSYLRVIIWISLWVGNNGLAIPKSSALPKLLHPITKPSSEPLTTVTNSGNFPPLRTYHNQPYHALHMSTRLL